MSARTIFGTDDIFTRYRVTLQVHETLVGGVPKDPDTIRKWLAARLELGDRELIELTEQTVVEMTDAGKERPTAEEVTEAVARQFASGNGFKVVDGQLVYEGRCMKAALKEAANVAYPGVDFPGKPKNIRKGLMRYLAERVFVQEAYIPLGVDRPSRTEQRIKHVQTPQGPRSAINVVDVVDKPTLTCTIAVLDDFLPRAAWSNLWQACEEIGIGADRARSDGKFDLLEWTRLND